MSLKLVLSGLSIRSITQVLSACVKISDTIYIEPQHDGVSFRAVGRTLSTHLFAVFPSAHFEEFSYQGAGAAAAEGVFFAVSSKAVLRSVLRYNANLSKLLFLFDPPHPDRFVVSQSTSTGVTKTFTLRLGEAAPEKPTLEVSDFTLKASADPKLWGSLFAEFSSITPTFTLFTDESRISIAADASVAASGTSQGCGPASSLVSIDRRALAEYTYPPTGNVPPPGKCIEAKPLKLFSMLCDQLQLTMRIRTGGPGVPVLLDGVLRHSNSDTPAVSHLSLLIAANDVDNCGPAAPPQQLETPNPRHSSAMSASNLAEQSREQIQNTSSHFTGPSIRTFSDQSATVIAAASVIPQDLSISFVAPSGASHLADPTPDSLRKRSRDDGSCVPPSREAEAPPPRHEIASDEFATKVLCFDDDDDEEDDALERFISSCAGHLAVVPATPSQVGK